MNAVTSTPPALEFALDYARRGFSVIPLRGSGTVEDRKRPDIAEWRQYQEVAADEEQLVAWWREDPGRNLAIITGSVSRVVVLDLDGPKASGLVREKVTLPRTAAVQTGRGFHAYYRHAGGEIANRARLLSDGNGSSVDVRGEGGYVVAPPSVHGSGRTYLWAVPLEELVELPPDLEELLLTGGESSSVPEPGEPWWVSVAGGVDQGGRNEAAARVAGYFARATGGNLEATIRALAIWNARNRPPLPEAELLAVVRSVLKRESLRVRAEDARKRPRLEVADGPQLATELERAEPRRGVVVDVPGIDRVQLVPGELLTLAARTSMGKSTLMTQITAEATLGALVPTLIFSTEMSRKIWGAWTAAVAWGCAPHELPRPWPRELLELFRRAPISLCDAGAPTIQEIRALAEGRPGVRLVIIDHVGRVGGGRRDTRSLEVGDVMRGLKTLARDLECTVIAVSQLNRDVEGRESKRPRLSDVRESGEIEQESDVVMFLYAPVAYNRNAPTRDLILAVEKFRHGALFDELVTFDLAGRRFVRRRAAGEGS